MCLAALSAQEKSLAWLSDFTDRDHNFVNTHPLAGGARNSLPSLSKSFDTARSAVLSASLMDGMDLIRATPGYSARLARALGITRGAVSQWSRVPAERVHDVSRAIGLAPHEIRPDLFEAPGRKDAAA